jgi:hypothetical protein
MMRIKIRRPKRRMETYAQAEVDLILSLPPTQRNLLNLAVSLERSKNAIAVVYQLAYSGNWLKKTLKGTTDRNDNVHTKIANAKRRLGIFIGHRPKQSANADA